MLFALMLVAILAGVLGSGAYRYLSLDWLKAQQHALIATYERAPLLFVAGFVALQAAALTLLIPGAVGLFALAAGAVMGPTVGTLVVLVAVTLGDSLGFLVARYLIRDWVARRFADRHARFARGVARGEISYLLALRLMAVVPYFVVNIAMALSRMRLRVFAPVSFIGLAPAAYLHVNAGVELGRVAQLVRRADAAGAGGVRRACAVPAGDALAAGAGWRAADGGRMMRGWAITALLVAGAAPAATPSGGVRMLGGSDLVWEKTPLGTFAAQLLKSGGDGGSLYVSRVRYAAGERSPTHVHPDPRVVTVARGTIVIGSGATLATRNMCDGRKLPRARGHAALRLGTGRCGRIAGSRQWAERHDDRAGGALKLFGGLRPDQLDPKYQEAVGGQLVARDRAVSIFGRNVEIPVVAGPHQLDQHLPGRDQLVERKGRRLAALYRTVDDRPVEQCQRVVDRHDIAALGGLAAGRAGSVDRVAEHRQLDLADRRLGRGSWPVRRSGRR